MQNQMDFGAAALGPHVLEDWINDVDESNTVEGKPVYFWVDQHDRTVPNDGGLVYLIFCSAISIKDMDISDNLFGVCMIGTYNSTVENVNVQNCALGFFLLGSAGITINNNTVTNGQSFVWNGMTVLASDGIGLLMSNDNTVAGNTISNMQDPGGPPTPQEGPSSPGVGIWIVGENNRVFHNNFVNNTHHAIATQSQSNMWDDGYPSGGNYWSDYTGIDLYCGSYQNETGSDGIGDSPYVIDYNNIDHFPLTEPWTAPDLAVAKMNTSKTGCTPLPTVCQNYTVTVHAEIENTARIVQSIKLRVYANETLIKEFEDTYVLNGTSMAFILEWDTHGFGKGNYTLSAVVEPVPEEINTLNNILDCWIIITSPGDINADGIVDIFDIATVALAFGSTPSEPNWNPVADINNDGTVDIFDIVVVAIHFGETG